MRFTTKNNNSNELLLNESSNWACSKNKINHTMTLTGDLVDKLASFEDLEESLTSLLRIGDIVYFNSSIGHEEAKAYKIINISYNISLMESLEGTTITEIQYNYKAHSIEGRHFIEFCDKDINDIIFLSKENAEWAYKKYYHV